MNKKIKENNKAFQLLSENFPNKRLRIKMLDLGNEYPEYAADELLLLSEEILSQVSAYGVCLYLKQGGKLQTEKNNDYILHDLFLHDGHQNAGPIFYRIRGIIQELSPENSKNDHVLSEKQKDLFDGESEINKKLQELAAFRNALMHGFFKLPAKRNEELVEEIQAILEKLLNHYELFKHKSDFHFWKNEGFSGHWNIQDNDDWNYLSGKNVTLFEKLASLAKDELHSPDFVKAVSVSHEPKVELEKKADLEGFISSDFKESLYVQFHPRHKQQQDEFYESTFALLKQKENVKLLSYTINENGIGYTSYLLIHHLLKNLGLQTNENDPKKKIKGNVAELKRNGKKMVILINNIHLVPFASDHITSLMKFFKESEIHFIGIGWEYEHLNSVFSQKLDLREERNERNAIPDDKELKQLIKNHTRHRGPFESEDEYKILLLLIEHILEQLENKQEIKARELADKIIKDQRPGIELVNEALYILYPYFKYVQSGEGSEYIKDDLDELYGFPKNQSETSSIFLTLGRRDIELEYKHKILKP